MIGRHEPGRACVAGTEAADLDGIVVEIAVIDAATGQVLLDTMVDPGGVPAGPGEPHLPRGDSSVLHGVSRCRPWKGRCPWEGRGPWRNHGRMSH